MNGRDDILVNEALLQAYIYGQSSPEEENAVKRWLAADPENEKQFEQLLRLCFMQRTYHRISSRNAYAAYERVCRRIERKSQKTMIRRVLSIAASVALLIAVSLSTYIYTRRSFPVSQTVTMYANVGMRTEFDLSDGTHVFLNAGSSLTYSVPFDTKQRNVLLQGEGFFSVTHDARRPFVVSTLNDKLQIEVLGTEFNVQAYKEDESIRTTLVNGRVKLNIFPDEGERISRMLIPSERAIYNRESNALHVSKVNTIYDTSWREGILMFRDTPLPEVLNRLSHFYDVSFEVRDTVIESYVFTGTFENRQLSQILDYLRITSQIKYIMVYPKEDDSHGIKRMKVILTK